MTNPLLVENKNSPFVVPAFDKITAEHIGPAIAALVTRIDEELPRIESARGATFTDIIEPLVDLTEPLTRAWGTVGHLMGVRNSDALRAAHKAAQPLVVAAFMKVAQSRPIFEKLEALQKSASFASLTDAERRILEKKLRDAKLSGVALEGEEKERFNRLEHELSELSTTFSNHVLDATKAFALHLTSLDDVAGIPDSAKAQFAQAARGAGDEKATAEHGPWRVTLDFPSYSAFMRYGHRRDHRRALYMAYVTRASGGASDNGPLIDEILRKRGDQARILGFQTYAELSLSMKMAGSVDAVEKLFAELHARSLAPARVEEADLDALAASGVPGIAAHDKVEAWDLELLSERQRERLFDFTDEDTRPYLPLPRVLEGLFALIGELFGVRVVEAPGAAPVWHDDARFYRVVDGRGDDVAAFYLDPYSRPAEKRGGAWMDDCVSRRRRPGDTKPRIPVAYLVCNGTPPVGETPSLMSFREVETLFHEFGHGLQHMLTTVDLVDASGINGVEWDAVELPSQFMENFCYDDATLIGMSGHHQTGEKMPRVLFEKIVRARTFRAASMMLRQLNFARLDLELHHRYTPGGSTTVWDVAERVAKETLVRQPPKENRFLASFTHIFSGGYAAGYYSYKWAEVLAADAFGAFEEAGPHDPRARVAIGARFRDTVLALGGSRHPLDVFRAFRGRAPTTDALLRQSGLLPKAA
jgi:oligopeptidase A